MVHGHHGRIFLEKLIHNWEVSKAYLVFTQCNWLGRLGNDNHELTKNCHNDYYCLKANPYLIYISVDLKII